MMTFVKQAKSFDITYYIAYSEGVSTTSMEPKKEKNAAGFDWGDIDTRLTKMEASVKVEESSAQH